MSDRYAAERGIPTLPACARSQISLDFDGRCLWMKGPIFRLYAAESGKVRRSGGFDYSPVRQREGGIGPILPAHIGSIRRRCGKTTGTTSPRVPHGVIIGSRFMSFQKRRHMGEAASLFMAARMRAVPGASICMAKWRLS
ncbi:hypothetical protein [Paraburkholderia sp.]|uniref:hypothetical protein n=1 Tax=Paraburkholderia sp. TaxID=1926495 RepID=UPI002F41FE09